MLNRNDLLIASPCGVDFRKMTRKEATMRFCDECKTHVHDLASMTESEARALLSSAPTEGRCIRYVADAGGRLLFLPDVPIASLTARKRAALAASVLAAAMELSGCATTDAPEPALAMAQPPIQPQPQPQPPVAMMGYVPWTPPVVVTPPGAPRTFGAMRGMAMVMVTDQPGKLMDNGISGQATMEHPFLNAACAGEANGCAEARELLAGSKTMDEFVAKLLGAGFTVLPVQTAVRPGGGLP